MSESTQAVPGGQRLQPPRRRGRAGRSRCRARRRTGPAAGRRRPAPARSGRRSCPRSGRGAQRRRRARRRRDGRPPNGSGLRQLGQVPAAVGVPPDQRRRVRPDRPRSLTAPVPGSTRCNTLVTTPGSISGVAQVITASRRRPAAGSFDHVPFAEAVHHAKFAGCEVEQSQPGGALLLTPDLHVVTIVLRRLSSSVGASVAVTATSRPSASGRAAEIPPRQSVRAPPPRRHRIRCS